VAAESEKESDESPLEREELTLPDGRRVLIYRRRGPPA
jgi:hypothetical protein